MSARRAPRAAAEPRTVRELVLWAARRFERAGLAYGHGTATAIDEAAWIVLHAAGLPPHELNAHLDLAPGARRVAAARALVERRIAERKPAAYLLGEAWLGPHRFRIDERVIVPRSFIAEWLRPGAWDAEPMLGGALASASIGRVLDLCTGSGCLAILAALAFPRAAVDAADLSPEALEVARANVRDYRLSRRVRLVRSDLFGALAGRRYDLIVSNPPYVNAASMRQLPAEYRAEPRLALASGADGLDHARRILAEARRHLEPGGLLVVEIGHNRGALERAFPKLALSWPPTASGPGYAFAIGRGALPSPRST